MRVIVVTVVKNDLEGLKRTENSILSQDCKVNWVIVTPNDNTETYVHAKRMLLDGVVDEIIEDVGGGVYAAMNLAIEKTDPKDWIWYLNAGDQFADPDSFSTVIKEIDTTNNRWIFGGHILGSDQGQILGKFSAPEKFKVANQLFARKYISHQSVIFCVSFLQQLNGFDEKLKIAADWDLLVRASQIDSGQSIRRLISIFYMGGISTKGRQISNWELFCLRKKYLGRRYLVKNYIWYGYRIFRNILVRSMEIVFPQHANSMRKLKFKLKEVTK